MAPVHYPAVVNVPPDDSVLVCIVIPSTLLLMAFVYSDQCPKAFGETLCDTMRTIGEALSYTDWLIKTKLEHHA